MTLLDVQRLFDFWKNEPPPGVLLGIIARMWGWKPPEPSEEPVSFEEAKAATADLFKDPARFFDGQFGKPFGAAAGTPTG